MIFVLCFVKNSHFSKILWNYIDISIASKCSERRNFDLLRLDFLFFCWCDSCQQHRSYCAAYDKEIMKSWTNNYSESSYTKWSDHLVIWTCLNSCQRSKWQSFPSYYGKPKVSELTIAPHIFCSFLRITHSKNHGAWELVFFRAKMCSVWTSP